MTPENFCYWLQGFNEIGGGKQPTGRGWQVIQDHLRLVFNKVTPERKPNSGEPVPVVSTGLVRERKIYDPKLLPTYCHQHPDTPPWATSRNGFPKNCSDASVNMDFGQQEQVLMSTC